MNTNDFMEFAKNMKKIAEDFDFGRNEILSVSCEHLPGFDDVAVRFSPTYDLESLAKEMNEICDEIVSSRGEITRRYFLHDNVEYFQLIGN